jgi:small subunit ribosomal protein S1
MEQHQSPIGEGSARPGPTLTMAELLDQSFDLKEVKRGDTLTGTIVRVSPSEILIDVGCKCEGIVSGRELERLSPQDLAELNVGDQVVVYVVRPEDDEEGHIALSLARAWVEKDWLTAQQMFESGDIYEGIVAGYNKGGLIVNFGRVRGFVPVSQLESSRGVARSGKEDQWSHMVGQTLRLKIIEIDRRRNRLIMSERAAMQEWRKDQKDRLLRSLSEGDVLNGRVTSLADFGAFVDLGGADGLIHLSEISWMPISHPREMLRVGDTVQVCVLQVDSSRQRISLSLKRLQPEPWSQVLEKYQIGQIVNAVITRLASFGAFAKVDEVEGLVHISELTDANITHPREVVNEGDNVLVKIIHIDPERRRMGLSLKQALGTAEWEEHKTTQQPEIASSEELPGAAPPAAVAAE